MKYGTNATQIFYYRITLLTISDGILAQGCCPSLFQLFGHSRLPPSGSDPWLDRLLYRVGPLPNRWMQRTRGWRAGFQVKLKKYLQHGVAEKCRHVSSSGFLFFFFFFPLASWWTIQSFLMDYYPRRRGLRTLFPSSQDELPSLCLSRQTHKRNGVAAELLRPVPRTTASENLTDKPILKARSIWNKTLILGNVIFAKNYDFLFIPETWQHDFDSKSSKELCPPRYLYLTQARTGRRGGRHAVTFRK